MQLGHIVHRLDGEQAGLLNAGDAGHHRVGPRSQDQLVVALSIHPAGGQVLHLHLLCLPVDGHRFAGRAGLDVVGCAQSLGGVQDQFFGFVHRPAQPVGQAAVGIGYMAALFQQDDPGLLVQPAQPGRGSRAAGVAANDDIRHVFHAPFAFFFIILHLDAGFKSKNSRPALLARREAFQTACEI